jgi:hypothetical protein
MNACFDDWLAEPARWELEARSRGAIGTASGHVS